MTAKILILALLLIGLVGCNQWDEVAERAVCNKAFPRSSAKAQACYDGRKLAYDARFANSNAEGDFMMHAQIGMLRR